MANVKDLVGKKFGNLTVLKREENIGKRVRWLCKCDCGKKKIIDGDHLRFGKIKTCNSKNNFHRKEREKNTVFRLKKLIIINPETSCWEWKGHIPKTGYPRIVYKGKATTASRVCWMLCNGRIRKGLYVLHKCDNPKCINPGHLFLGTQKQNVRDMIEKGRAGYEKRIGMNHSQVQLTDDQVISIRHKAKSGIDFKTLAVEYNTTSSNIYNIVTGKTWKHLPFSPSAPKRNRAVKNCYRKMKRITTYSNRHRDDL